jgi:nucleotide-binding universal stress UspA family protein
MRILVPIASQRSAEIVSEYVVRVARSLGAEIVALHVHETAEPSPVGLGGLEVIRAAAEAAGLPARTVVEQGPLVRGIQKVAEDEDVNLVVMGFHPFMPVAEWTASKVLESSDLPVVVIPHGLPR